MIKLKNLGWVGVLALLAGFGTNAYAQANGAQAVAGSFTQSSNSSELDLGDDNAIGGTGGDADTPAVSSAPTVAAELFGPGTGVKLEFGEDGFKPLYKLTYIQATEYTNAPDASPRTTGASTTHSVESGDEGMITYTLSGATFAERVSPNDFAFAGDTAATLTIESGGGKGDSSVAVKVTAAANWTATTIITFTLPDVEATGRSATKPVRMSSSYSIAKTSNFPEGGPRNAACGETADGQPASARGCKVVNAMNKISGFTLSGAASGMIDLADRAKLVGGDGNQMADIAIGTVTVAVADAAGTSIMGQDGKPASLTSDLAGDVAISVASSQFRDGDIVYIDDNKSKTQDDGRELFVIADGAATADRAIKAGSWTVRYMPNGEDALMHGTALTVSAKTDFTDRDNLNSDAKAGTAKSITSMLNLAGIKPNPAMAYAIAPLSSTDMSNVRITCESGKACMAFLSCHDGDGTDYFGDMGVEVPANGTARLNQMAVSEALGMAEGEGWSGRLACDVLSTAPISVQVLTRAEGVLVNNTYVGEGGN